MGWNGVTQRHAHPVWQGIPDRERFYFVHSYFAVPSLDKVIAGVSTYGVEFTCAVARDNVFAVQFHPEKSQATGLATDGTALYLGEEVRQFLAGSQLSLPFLGERPDRRSSLLLRA